MEQCKKCKRAFNAQRAKTVCPDCSDLFCADCFSQSANFIAKRRVCASCYNVHSQLYGAQRKLKGHDAFKKKNWKSAFALYEGVEDKYQDPILCVRIGLILARGMGVKRDADKAAQLFATALPLLQAKPEEVEYIYYLGVMYDNGFGVPQSNNLAFAYYKMASDQGDSNAQFNIGYMYQKGSDDVEQDWANAFKYFKLSANRDNPDAQFKLGYLYAHGYGVAKDEQAAFKFYTLAAQQGDPSALCNLGYLHQYGLGTDVDFEKAMIYYKKAAEKKCNTAFSHIGYLYEFGLGVQKNNEEAFKNYKLASDAGVRNGHSFLGQWYETAEDITQAKHYYGLAAALGDQFAIDRLKVFEGTGDHEDT